MVAGGELGLLWDEVAFFPQTAAFLSPPPPFRTLFSPPESFNKCQHSVTFAENESNAGIIPQELILFSRRTLR